MEDLTKQNLDLRFSPDDCVLGGNEFGEYGILNGDTEEVICCPVWIHGANTYAMTNLEYYKVT